ncbi:hypothetical protein RchiOBHm_Chr6g0260351 [Rosa chinensis]|uniref:Photosystem II n=1 Tax=Rosa chinensis TaxID=74649 RepID=A0A2P6PN36_ROSCH|nr:hypothetical protein RchiOBHm_Chr6g0260351 [Rosa chinensis]
MGTFIGHIVPGFALTLLGLWHTVNTIGSYFLKGPSNFGVRFWYPLNCPFSKIKHWNSFSSYLSLYLQLLCKF